jgi:hypothetical protein
MEKEKTALKLLFELWIENRGILIPEDFHNAMQVEKNQIIKAYIDGVTGYELSEEYFNNKFNQ